jgi:hypothetical protein
MRRRYFAKRAELMMEADLPDQERHRIWKSILRRKPKRDSLNSDEQSAKVFENKGLEKTNFPSSVDVDENKHVSRFCADVYEK